MNPSVVAEASVALSKGPCPCQGRYDPLGRPNSHFVWIAFLHYDNDEFRREQCLRDYNFLPLNRVTCALSRSDIIHVQIMFWKHRDGRFETISVDSTRGNVHSQDQKRFRRGWTFYRLEIEKWQEVAMYMWCQQQIGKEMDTIGMHLLPLRRILPFMQTATSGDRYYCAELVMSALQCANLFWSVSPNMLFPSNVRDVIKDLAEVPFHECSHPIIYKTRRQIHGLDTSSAPTSLANTIDGADDFLGAGFDKGDLLNYLDDEA